MKLREIDKIKLMGLYYRLDKVLVEGKFENRIIIETNMGECYLTDSINETYCLRYFGSICYGSIEFVLNELAKVLNIDIKF